MAAKSWLFSKEGVYWLTTAGTSPSFRAPSLVAQMPGSASSWAAQQTGSLLVRQLDLTLGSPVQMGLAVQSKAVEAQSQLLATQWQLLAALSKGLDAQSQGLEALSKGLEALWNGLEALSKGLPT